MKVFNEEMLDGDYFRLFTEQRQTNETIFSNSDFTAPVLGTTSPSTLHNTHI